jgi:hypothetical protein
MRGYRFQKAADSDPNESTFDKLLKIFQDLLVYTSGNVDEALSWLTALYK